MVKIRVNIYDKAHVPSLGRGPFTDKLIDIELFRSLKRLGYLVEEIKEPVVKKLVLDSKEEVATSVEITTETESEVIPPVETVEEPEVETVDETVEEPEVETVDETVEEFVEVEEASAETEVEEEELFTEDELNFLAKKAKRGEIVDLFTEKGVEIPDEDATIAELLELIGLVRK